MPFSDRAQEDAAPEQRMHQRIRGDRAREQLQPRSEFNSSLAENSILALAGAGEVPDRREQPGQ